MTPAEHPVHARSQRRNEEYSNTWGRGRAPFGLSALAHWSYDGEPVAACGVRVSGLQVVPVAFTASQRDLAAAVGAAVGPLEVCRACVEIWLSIAHPIRVGRD